MESNFPNGEIVPQSTEFCTETMTFFVLPFCSPLRSVAVLLSGAEVSLLPGFKTIELLATASSPLSDAAASPAHVTVVVSSLNVAADPLLGAVS